MLHCNKNYALQQSNKKYQADLIFMQEPRMAQSYGIEGYLFSGAVILFIILLILEKNIPTCPYLRRH